MPSLDEMVAALQELQVRRKFCIKAVNRQSNAAGALVRRALGIRLDGDEAEREKGNVRAARIVAAVLNGKPQKSEDHNIAGLVAFDLELVAQGIAPYDKARHQFELEMRRIARKLPAAEWANSVRGLGELALAVIVGEAGELSRYGNEGKLWKRLGLAPYNGKAASTWRREGGLKAEDWVELGYAPSRRAEVYACVGDPLFRAQTAAKDGTRAAGKYRIAYDARRARTAETHADWTKGHSHADGLRIMTKSLILDLWVEWRRAEGLLLSIPAVPDAEDHTLAEAA